jgi:predicted glycoside hydrolase/deacetylase ChbG (UPF0249 family)
VGHDQAGSLDLSALHHAIRAAAELDVPVVELGCHPGTADDPARRRYRWNYHWADELAALCDPATEALIRSNGFSLTDFGSLGAAA